MKRPPNRHRLFLYTLIISNLLLISSFSYADIDFYPKSAIRIDAEKHFLERYQPRFYKSAEQVDIIPLQERVSDDPGLDHIVFGFLPWWMLKTAEPSIELDLISHLAVFNFACDANGDYPIDTNGDTIAYPVGWPQDWENLLNRAHEKGVKILMSISALNFSEDIMHNILRDTIAADNLIKNTEKIIKRYNLDGAIINFEHPYGEDKGEVMNSFVQRMNDQLKARIGPEQILSFAAPPINWRNRWDLPGLIAATDFTVIMGYDFWWSGSENTGPCAPIYSGNYNLNNTLENIETGYGACDKSKLVLIYPYYGFTWEVNEAQKSMPHAVTLADGDHIIYSEIVPKYRDLGVHWDSLENEPFTYYKQNGKWYQSWCDNSISLSKKQQLIHDHGLMGTGIWALGYDGAYPDLWNVLKENYFVFSNSLNMDDFENGHSGRFYHPPAYSDSTQGISTDSYSELCSRTSFEGDNSLKVILLDDESSDLSWEVHLPSASGIPEKNAPIPQGYYLKFAAKTNRSGLQIAALLNDRKGELEISLPYKIIGDMRWHEYSIKLDNSSTWKNYSNGNANIDTSHLTLNALVIYSQENYNQQTLYLDGIKAEENGEASKPDPTIHLLYPAYPNPFDETVHIDYDIKMNAHVVINVYDLKGKKVECLVDREQTIGLYSSTWNATSYPSGIYFLQMKVDGGVAKAIKITHIK